MMGKLIGGFVTILVGVTLIPSIADDIQGARYGNGSGQHNITGASGTILGLVTLFFALGVASAGLAVAAQGLKAAGVI